MNEFSDYKNIKEEKEEDVQYFCKFTFGQFFTILVLEVVTLAFVFYLGAKYGTNYLKIDQADNERPAVTEVVAGKTSAVSQDAELQAMARDALKGGTSGDLKERVDELLQKEGGQQQAGSVQQPAPAVQPVQSIESAKIQQKETSLPKTTINTESKPEAKVETKPETDSGAIKIKSAANSQYSIQIGSYPNMNEASEKVQEWRAKGYPSFMMIADIPDRGRWYRVRIGGFAAKEDAQGYLEKFRANEGAEGIVVLNEQ